MEFEQAYHYFAVLLGKKKKMFSDEDCLTSGCEYWYLKERAIKPEDKEYWWDWRCP